MGYAQIIGGGPEGRYTARLDFGDAQRLRIVAALEQKLATTNTKITETEAQVAAGAAAEANQLAIIDAYVVALEETMETLPPGSPFPSADGYTLLLKNLRSIQTSNAPAKIALAALKAIRAETNSKLTQFRNLQTLETRSLWCADFTETATGYVATVEIPGESERIVIAPSARAWKQWDGTITTAKKAAKLTALSTARAALDAQIETLNASISAKEATEALQQAAYQAASTAFLADRSAANAKALDDAQRAVAATGRELLLLRADRAALILRRVDILKKEAQWNAKPASDRPVYGDGQLVARELMSPEQAYFNAAILPGWQIDTPTHRFGTLTSVDWDSNIANVTIDAATSSAQALNVNRKSALTAVPIEYMQTNCRALGIDDRVVIEFRQLLWDEPVVIGFLQEPRPDPPTWGANGDLSSPTYSKNQPVSADLSIYWQYGAEPFDYSVKTGTLPAGLTFDDETGLLSGTPTAAGTSTGLVLRCADKHYVSGKNRRYDDSNAFDITILGGWNFFTPLSMALLALTDTEYLEFNLTSQILTADSGGYVIGDGLVKTSIRSGPNGGLTLNQVETEQFCDGGDLVGFPLLWHRINGTGEPWGGKTSTQLPNVWYAGLPGYQWIMTDLLTGYGTWEATYTIDIATDSAGAEIVCTISGSIEGTIVDPF